MKIQFIVLACSYKHGGRCVAGIDMSSKKLIRLISKEENTNYAIPKEECILNGRSLLPLDIIDVEIEKKAENNGAQTENYYYVSPLIRAYVGKAIEEQIEPYRFKSNVSPYPFDTKDSFLSSGAYKHKDYSLCLIKAYKLSINNITNSMGENKTKISFDVYKYNGEKVRLVDYLVTDPQYVLIDGNNKAKKVSIGKAWLLISLGQDDNTENYYKFVSGIIDMSAPNNDYIDLDGIF